jgi:3-dehydroquinate dehydratase/shikimate dehydrogenase
MNSLLCETVTGETMADLIAARDRSTVADMVEVRRDGVADPNVAHALHQRRVPVVVTCRPVWEGGRFRGSEEERGALLERAAAQGAEYVDVEWRAVRDGTAPAFTRLLDTHRERIVLSMHDFDGVPAGLADCARAMRQTRAAVIKIAFAASCLSDTLPLADVAREGDAVVIGMGDAGVPTRLLATRFGSKWTYGGDGVAPGQIPVRAMVEQFRFRDIGPRTTIYGVAGARALQSATPARRNAEFAATGRDAVCVPLPTEDRADYEAFADALDIAGATWETETD